MALEHARPAPRHRHNGTTPGGRGWTQSPGGRWTRLAFMMALLAALVMASGAGTARATGSGMFAAKVDYATGMNTASVAEGDFNGDGKLDLVTANYVSDGTVSVLLGNGDGTFRAKRDYATGPGTSPDFVAVGDFNRDGKLDIVTANYVYSGNAVTVLLGNGDGTFQAAAGYAAGGTAESVAVGDFNKDGWPDLVVTNYVTSPGNKISVLLNSGTGTFLPPVTYTAGQYPYRVAVGDLNQDGNLDLAVTNPGGTGISVLLGTSTGAFLPATNYLAGIRTYGVAIGDFDRNGSLDLAVTTLDPADNVRVLLNNGAGAFPTVAATYTATGRDHEFIVAADLNGDGAPDLVAPNLPRGASAFSGVSVFLNTGTGSFGAKSDYPTSGYTLSAAVGRFNQDSAPDLAVTNDNAQYTNGTVSVLLNRLVAPAVSGVNPASGPTAGGQPVTISGTGFEVGAAVTVGGTPCAGATLVSATTMTCTPGGHAAGAVDVTVTNYDGQSGTRPGGYTYSAPAAPPPAPAPVTGPGSNYSGWQPLPSRLAGYPPAVGSFQNQLVVAMVGSGNQLYLTRSADGVNFGDWQPLGGLATSAPALAVHDGQLSIFARGSDNAVYVSQSGDGVTFTPWRSLGGVLTGAPAATSFNGQLLVFAAGRDGALYVTSSATGSNFSAWQSLGGRLNREGLDPVAVIANQGRLFVYARGNDNALYVTSSPDGMTYTAWSSLGGVLSSGPAAASDGNTMAVYVRGADGRLYETRTTDGEVTFSTWRDLGGVLATAPAATSFQHQFYLATGGVDQRIYLQSSQP